MRKDRIIHLSKQSLPYLERYLAFPKRFWRNSEYLFPSRESPHVSAKRMRNVFREKVLKPCGLYESEKFRTRLYSLRKSRATHLLEQSKDLYLCANILGHKDVSTTAAYYIHTNKEYSNYVGKMMDGEAESLRTPDIQINQTNNFNILIEQLTIVLQQQQKQNELLLNLMNTRENPALI